MKFPRRFRLTTLFLVVTISAFAFTAFQYFSASARYKRNGDVETLRYLLSTRIESGDSIERVASLLGTGRRDDGTHLARLLKWKRKGPHFDPNVIGPDGMREGDLLVFYSADPKGSYQLHFRDGVLINFDPVFYVGPDDTIWGLSQ